MNETHEGAIWGTQKVCKYSRIEKRTKLLAIIRTLFLAHMLGCDGLRLGLGDKVNCAETLLSGKDNMITPSKPQEPLSRVHACWGKSEGEREFRKR